MNKLWSELNKTMQSQIKKKDTYEEGIGTLFDLRNQLTLVPENLWFYIIPPYGG